MIMEIKSILIKDTTKEEYTYDDRFYLVKHHIF